MFLAKNGGLGRNDGVGAHVFVFVVVLTVLITYVNRLSSRGSFVVQMNANFGRHANGSCVRY